MKSIKILCSLLALGSLALMFQNCGAMDSTTSGDGSSSSINQIREGNQGSIENVNIDYSETYKFASRELSLDTKEVSEAVNHPACQHMWKTTLKDLEGGLHIKVFDYESKVTTAGPPGAKEADFENEAIENYNLSSIKDQRDEYSLKGSSNTRTTTRSFAWNHCLEFSNAPYEMNTFSKVIEYSIDNNKIKEYFGKEAKIVNIKYKNSTKEALYMRVYLRKEIKADAPENFELNTDGYFDYWFGLSGRLAGKQLKYVNKSVVDFPGFLTFETLKELDYEYNF